MASSDDSTWLPLESNPETLNKFCKRMGLPKGYGWVDIWGMDPDLLEFVPKPCCAVSLLFPSGDSIRKFKQTQAEKIQKEGQEMPDLYYLHQLDGIGNACGSIAAMHALANQKLFDLEEGPLSAFIKKTKSLNWTKRGEALKNASSLQEVSDDAAVDEEINQTEAPTTDTKVNAHFISFVMSNFYLMEMDGRKKFPVNHGKTSQETFLLDVAKVVKANFMDVDPTNLNFNLMGLVKLQSS